VEWSNDHRIRLAAIVLFFMVMALITARHKAPFIDEAMMFSPAVNLIQHGYMGTSIIDPTSELREGMSLRGIDRYTYQVMPLFFLAQAGWYKLAGSSLWTLRALSTLFGALALIAWYIIIAKLGGNRSAALVGVALIATDGAFVEAGSFGRCDMASAALSAMAIAAYAALREEHFGTAILLGHSLAAASLFTHPAGILAAAALVILPLYFDRARLKASSAALAITPYLVAAGGWGLYILKAPDLFAEQLRTNAANRLYGITQPWLAVWSEIRYRYLDEFGFRPGDGPGAHLKLFLLMVYALAPLAVWFTPALRARKGVRALLLMALSNLFILTIFEGTKQGFYLVHVLPLYGALLALWAVEGWNLRPTLRPALAALLVAFVGLQLMRTISINRKDRMDNAFHPVVAFLKQNAAPSQLIMGSCELAFGIGFDANVVDDHRLGYFSGKRPDIVVVDARYRELFHLMRSRHSEISHYVQDYLRQHFTKRYDQESYEVYFRSS